jgi:hypothetical protein
MEVKMEKVTITPETLANRLAYCALTYNGEKRDPLDHYCGAKREEISGNTFKIRTVGGQRFKITVEEIESDSQ